MSRIKPLAADSVAQIQSMKHITNLNDVVLSLLENSLDAGSTKITVSLDFERASCSVEDNGCGILSDDFREQGGLARVHYSSCSESDCLWERYGWRGSFLASLGALSLVTIASRHRDETCTSCLTLHRASVISRDIPAKPSDESSVSSAHGTRVSVYDLFGNVPVRLKQRLSTTETPAQRMKQWHELKSRVVSIWLAASKPCSLKIENASSVGQIMHISTCAKPSALTEKNLREFLGKPSPYDLRDALPVLYQAGLAPKESRSQWIPMSARTQTVTIKGLICSYPVATKQWQFISLGIHPCSAASGYQQLYDSINHLFDRSDFGLPDGSIADGLPNATLVRLQNDNTGRPSRKHHGSKSVERWPMFVIRIILDESCTYHPVLLDTGAAWLQSSSEVLAAAVTQWLRVNHFRPQNAGRRGSGDTRGSLSRKIHVEKSQPNPSGTNLSTSSAMSQDTSGESGTSFAEVHGKWSLIKGAKPLHPWPVIEQSSQPVKTSFAPQDIDTCTLSGPTTDGTQNTEHLSLAGDNSLMSDNFREIPDHELLASEMPGGLPSSTQEEDKSALEWKDVKTGKTYMIDSITGVLLPWSESNRTSHADPAGTTSMSRSSSPPELSGTLIPRMSIPSRLKRSNINSTPWLRGLLQQWDNPVFKPQKDRPISTAIAEDLDVQAHVNGQRVHSRMGFSRHFQRFGTTRELDLSKGALAKARVIGQVDSKFILCSTRSEDPNTGQCLLLVDQHAASERVILEELLRELSDPLESVLRAVKSAEGHQPLVKHVLLEKPLQYEIAPSEGDLLRRNAPRFARWGIVYNLIELPLPLSSADALSSCEAESLTVLTLPVGIAERCIAAPSLLLNILRSDVWDNYPQCTLGASALGKTDDTPDSERHPWVRRLAACPNGIIQMLNSRACRSAIMFNDPLTNAQCQQLLDQLAECAFPFMCAHGRVSMVPLIEIGDHGHGLEPIRGFEESRDKHEDAGLTQVLQRWMKSAKGS